MKKSFVLLLATVTLSLGSCKKDYSCICSMPGLKDPDISQVHMKEEDAKAYCASKSLEWQVNSGSCYLSSN